MIFGAQDTDVNVAQTCDLRPSIERIDTLIIQRGKTTMHVNSTLFNLDLVQDAHGRGVLRGSDHNVMITIWTQAMVWVKPRRRPAFNQDRFHPGRPQSHEHFL
jgi:hypothetical protein